MRTFLEIVSTVIVAGIILLMPFTLLFTLWHQFTPESLHLITTADAWFYAIWNTILLITILATALVIISSELDER